MFLKLPPSRPERPSGVEQFSDFSQIYEDHAPSIYYLTLRWLGDPSKAEDATHDVFVKAFNHLENFKHRSEVRTWLYRIAINHCKNLRSTWHQRNIALTHNGNFDEGAVIDNRTPLQVAEAKDLGRRIQETLDQLPEEYRIILLCVANEEMSYEEIADLTQQSSDAVRGKIYRARKAFATAYNQTT